MKMSYYLHEDVMKNRCLFEATRERDSGFWVVEKHVKMPQKLPQQPSESREQHKNDEMCQSLNNDEHFQEIKTLESFVKDYNSLRK